MARVEAHHMLTRNGLGGTAHWQSTGSHLLEQHVDGNSVEGGFQVATRCWMDQHEVHMLDFGQEPQQLSGLLGPSQLQPGGFLTHPLLSPLLHGMSGLVAG